MTGFTRFVVSSQQPETSHRIPKTAVGPGIDACLINAVKYAMRDLGDRVESEALLCIARGRDSGFKFILQGSVLEVEAVREIYDSHF